MLVCRSSTTTSYHEFGYRLLQHNLMICINPIIIITFADIFALDIGSPATRTGQLTLATRDLVRSSRANC